MPEMLTSLKFIRELYRANGFAVGIFRDDKSREYKCAGPLPVLVKNVKYDISIVSAKKNAYGSTEYRADLCVMSKCQNKEDIITLLTSSIFQGIGKKTAKAIYDKFGDDTLDAISKEPSALTQIKGITKDRAWKIYLGYARHTMETRTYQYLAPFGFNARQAQEAVRLSPTEDALDYIAATPYTLTKIRGVTFEMADAVAKDNAIPPTDISRIAAAAEQIIKKEMTKGHAAAAYKDLATPMIELLKTEEINQHTIARHIRRLIDEELLAYRKVSENGNVVFYTYLPNVLKAEKTLAETIKESIKAEPYMKGSSVEAYIELEERKNGISLDDSQKEAVKLALSNHMSVITGGPGTGKTTVIKTICNIWRNKFGSSKGITLMSPTGRAARRMKEATGLESGTIHSTLKLGIEEKERGSKSEECIEDSLVVIDESSMLDMFLARDVMERISGCCLVLIGDADQLPSVGSGKVLSDIIESGAVPVARLEHVHRQKEGSAICANADRIKCGNADIKAAKDFSIIHLKPDYDGRSESTMEMVENKMISEYLRLADRYGKDNVALLCPYNKHAAGQESINIRLQEKLNPFRDGIKEFKAPSGQTIRIADPVMQLINRDGVSNGEVGYVTAIDEVDGKNILSVKYTDTYLEYDYEAASEITLAYAMTVHKSQGSEYDAIVTCMTEFHGSMLKRNILYTAITRGKKEAVLIGSRTAIERAITNDGAEHRNTMLAHDLKDTKDNTEGVKNSERECSQLSLAL